MVPEFGGHGQEFGHKLVSEYVSEADHHGARLEAGPKWTLINVDTYKNP